MISELHDMLGRIERHTDASRINEIVNHADVAPYVRGDRDLPLDMQPALDQPGNVLLMGEHGGILFHHRMPGLYEAHTSVLKEGRGEWTLAMTRAALHLMFTCTDAIEVITRCPKGNVAAKALTKAAGLTYEYTNRQGWVMNGEPVSADVYALKIQDWMKEAPGLVERGQWLDERLGAEYGRFQADPPDSTGGLGRHRFVGAAFEMILNGQPDKGVVFQRRWAAMADADPIGIVLREPLAVGMADATLIVRDGDFYIATLNADPLAGEAA